MPVGLNIISKRVVLDVCGRPGYASEIFASNHLINFPETTSVTGIKLLESDLI